MLKFPPKYCAVITKKGKETFEFLRYGSGPFDYAVYDFSTTSKNNLPLVIPLADEDWAKHSVKKAAEKKALSGFWNENKGAILFTTALVISLVIMLATVQMLKDAIGEGYSTARSVSQSTGPFATAIIKIANECTSSSNNGGSENIETPPGM
jgi:hypothetical protein